MFHRAVLLAGLVLLTSCVSQPLKVTQDPQARQAALERLNAFRVTGGLGVWTDKESISTRIDWQQNSQDFDILIRLPAGLSTMRVTQNAGLATVQRGSAAPVSGSSASTLMQQALGLGVAVPVEQMALWIRGLPGDQAESASYDKEQRLAAMDYRDSQGTLWRAKVLKYSVYEDVYVPALITATGGPYNVRLVLKEWGAIDETRTALSNVTKQQGQGSSRLKVPGR